MGSREQIGLISSGRAEQGLASAALASDELPESKTRLLRANIDVHPSKSRRLQGIVDVLRLILIVIPFLMLRAARYILSWIGITEHK